MPPRFALVPILLLVLQGAALAAPATSAIDRGRLSLAWDAHESGLLEEALDYVADIAPTSPVAGEALWLRADCLYRLERYEEAAHVLESAPADALEDRDAFLFDVVWDWAWSATRREDYGEAARVLARGLRSLPSEASLAALAEATRFREAVRRALEEDAGRLDGGGEVVVRPRGLPPAGGGWVRAYPWSPDAPWIPQATLEDWMPSRAARLRAEDRTLWIRLPASAVRRQIEAASRARGLTLGAASGGLALADGDDRVAVDEAEWRYRAAAEGLGPKGAAAFAVAGARDALAARAALVAWVREHRGALEVSRAGGLLVLHHPESGRSLELDPAAWTGYFDPEGAEWKGFWTDVTAELARPTRPFRCFCGREVVLREELAPRGDGAYVFERGPGYALLVAALCPLHRQYVTEDLLREWGVTAVQAWDRARRDALGTAWEVSFRRGEVQGSPYLVLEGAGVASLARTPPLLLGALEAVDGVAVRGSAVRVVAPSASTLVVAAAGTPEPAAAAALTQVLLAEGRRGDAVERLGYRATVQLPGAGEGTFRMSSSE